MEAAKARKRALQKEGGNALSPSTLGRGRTGCEPADSICTSGSAFCPVGPKRLIVKGAARKLRQLRLGLLWLTSTALPDCVPESCVEVEAPSIGGGLDGLPSYPIPAHCSHSSRSAPCRRAQKGGILTGVKHGRFRPCASRQMGPPTSREEGLLSSPDSDDLDLRPSGPPGLEEAAGPCITSCQEGQEDLRCYQDTWKAPLPWSSAYLVAAGLSSPQQWPAALAPGDTEISLDPCPHLAGAAVQCGSIDPVMADCTGAASEDSASFPAQPAPSALDVSIDSRPSRVLRGRAPSLLGAGLWKRLCWLLLVLCLVQLPPRARAVDPVVPQLPKGPTTFDTRRQPWYMGEWAIAQLQPDIDLGADMPPTVRSEIKLVVVNAGLDLPALPPLAAPRIPPECTAEAPQPMEAVARPAVV